MLFYPSPHLQAKLRSKWGNSSAEGLQSLVEKISTPSPLMFIGRWVFTMHPRRDSIKALGPFIPLYWVAFLFKMCVDFSAKKAESLSDHTYHYHFFRFSMCKEVSHSYANVLGRRRLASNRTSMPTITTLKSLTCFRFEKK